MTGTDSTAATAQQMGQHLRHVREDAGLAVDTVAQRLRMPKHLVRSLEEGDWSRLGAPVFVRGHLRSYARLLQIELAGLDEITESPPMPVTPMVRSGRGQQIFGRLGTRLVYAVITVLIGVPIWIAAQRHLATPLPTPLAVTLDVPEIQPPLPTPLPDEPPSSDASASTLAAPPAAPPLTAMASLLPSAMPVPVAPPASEITLHMNQDSWVELYAPDGSSLEQRLLPAGEVRGFANAEGVTLRIGGEIQDLTGVRRANVARFAVSSDGSIRPVAD